MEQTNELERLGLEKARLECKLKETEVELKRRELASKEHNSTKRASLSSPLTIALITGFIGIITVGIANYLQSAATLRLEQEKAESALILKAIETGDREVAAKNLVFLVEIGLIHDKTGKIAGLENQPLKAPVLPRQSRALDSTGDCGVWQSITSEKRYTFVCRTENQFDVYENDPLGLLVKVGSGQFDQGNVELDLFVRSKNQSAHLSLKLSDDGRSLDGSFTGSDPRESGDISFHRVD
jgi:hypothetical protein